MISVKGQLTHFENPRFDATEVYSEALKSIFSLQRSQQAIDEITQWPEYQVTPLLLLQHLAQSIGVDRIYYKDESQRFGLKSFKALGGAYAVARQLQQQVELSTGTAPSIQQLLDREYDDIVKQVVISCATDGNHGRSVAWGCQMFGCPCVIYIHRDVSVVREQAMQAFGARVIRITGNYDDSIKQADYDARIHHRIIVSDTSYAGYMDIPRDVALGYSVLLAESIQQLAQERPTHVFIQGGVGGLAAAVCAYFWEYWGKNRPRFVIVEPEQANCLQQSARAGQPVIVNGDLDTLMAGLACGEVSVLAWQILQNGANDFMTINEAAVAPTMQLLAQGFNGDPQIEAGESAVAGLAALITAREDASLSKALALNEQSRVYLIGTEGATDPELYQQLING